MTPHSHQIYCHKIWPDGDLTWSTLTHKVTWLFKNIVLTYHVTKEKHDISTVAVLMTNKLCKVMTYHEGQKTCRRSMPIILNKMVTYRKWIPPKNSHFSLIMWPRWGNAAKRWPLEGSCSKLKTYLHFHKTYG